MKLENDKTSELFVGKMFPTIKNGSILNGVFFRILPFSSKISAKVLKKRNNRYLADKLLLTFEYFRNILRHQRLY